MSQDKTLVLVDGSSYLYRAYYALPSLTTSSGEPTGAMYGVINMIRKTRKAYPSQYIAVVFDAKGRTFRDDLFEQYKANRPAMEDDLSRQIQPLLEIIEAQGLPLLREEGVEADDVIASLAESAKAKGLQVIISTGDKDLAQLVNSQITLVNTMSDKHYDEQAVIDKFGIQPEQIVDYLALVGDNIDNIPGVPKVGPKTAVKWLQQYQNIDNLLGHIDDIKGKIKENLRAYQQQLELSRRLVSLDHQIDPGVQPEALTPRSPDQEKLKHYYQQYEMRSWLDELLAQQQNEQTAHYEWVNDETSFNNWLQKLQTAELFAFDTETTSLLAMYAHLVGISFAITPHEAAYVPLAHNDGSPQLNRQWVLNQLKPLLENAQKPKLGHNLKYDMTVLKHYGITLKGIQYDTMVESYLLNPSINRHDLDSAALKHLGYRTTPFEEVTGSGKKQLTFDQVPAEQATHYAAEDADIALRLHQTLWPQLEPIDGVNYAFNHIEMPLVPVLARMEYNGVKIDTDELQQQSASLAERLQQLEQKAFRLAGQTFNLGSPKQLQEVLFQNGGLPVLQKTPKGQPSTSESVLQQLALDYPLPEVILEHRSLSKLKSTYTDKLPLQVNPNTGRIHTSYNQAVTTTGRLSSTEPNLQNIPIRSEQGLKIRRAFIAEPGYKLVSADYSQIELRIMAHISDDDGLKQAFAQDLDIHSATASEVFGVPFDEISDQQRRSAKAINFGLLYGMSAYGLAQQLNIEPSEASAYIDRYFNRYPGVKRYMDHIRQQAAELGYVETMFGRRLYLPEIHSSNVQRQRGAERAAINAPMQGTAADIIKIAMVNIDRWLRDTALDGRMIMQVHDELIFEVAATEVDQLCQHVTNLMDLAVRMSVPLKVDVGVGDNWAQAH